MPPATYLRPSQSTRGCDSSVEGPTLGLLGEEGMMRHGEGRVGGVDTAGDEDPEVAAPRPEAALRDRGHLGDGLRSEGHRGEARRLRWPSSQGAREEGVKG